MITNNSFVIGLRAVKRLHCPCIVFRLNILKGLKGFLIKCGAFMRDYSKRDTYD